MHIACVFLSSAEAGAVLNIRRNVQLHVWVPAHACSHWHARSSAAVLHKASYIACLLELTT